ncbi:hypothetical protein [Mycobacterium sp. AZCC_0083]|uniref:hypothetical protein n=1 Tax=Mycobacterium sp. AZCC_0083 TaxID=2735882 RepID=UPI001619EAF6|nr:hypothetical protein [Mycobacterium sp. AZCC_0083]MBB5166325.1 hypothetical protein [Mycobacterium sp. AZCC_0083]
MPRGSEPTDEKPVVPGERRPQQSHREDQFGDALGECVRQPTFDGEAGRHSGQHQEDRGGYPPLLEPAGQQRPAGDDARDRNE